MAELITRTRVTEGGISGFLVSLQPIFGLLFRFSHLKTAVFPLRFKGFLRFSLWFSVFVDDDGCFSDSVSVPCILRFL